MLRNALIVILLTVVFVGSLQAEIPTQSRLLFHGTKELTDNWGVAGWLIFPNIVSGNTNLIIAGPRYNFNKGWVEFLGGQLIKADESSTVWNIRASSEHLLIHFWGEVEYFSQDDKLYWFLQANYPISLKETFIGKPGIETENVHQKDESSQIGFGPHVILPVSQNMTLIIAHQWKYTANEWDRFYRFYIVFDL